MRGDEEEEEELQTPSLTTVLTDCIIVCFYACFWKPYYFHVYEVFSCSISSSMAVIYWKNLWWADCVCVCVYVWNMIAKPFLNSLYLPEKIAKILVRKSFSSSHKAVTAQAWKKIWLWYENSINNLCNHIRVSEWEIFLLIFFSGGFKYWWCRRHKHSSTCICREYEEMETLSEKKNT